MLILFRTVNSTNAWKVLVTIIVCSGELKENDYTKALTRNDHYVHDRVKNREPVRNVLQLVFIGWHPGNRVVQLTIVRRGLGGILRNIRS